MVFTCVLLFPCFLSTLLVSWLCVQSSCFVCRSDFDVARVDLDHWVKQLILRLHLAILVVLDHCVKQLILRLHLAILVVLDLCVKQLVLRLHLAILLDDSSGLNPFFYFVFWFLVLFFLSLPLSIFNPSNFGVIESGNTSTLLLKSR